MTDAELLQSIEKLRNLMVSVATGGPRIDQVKSEYQFTYENADAGLRERDMENPNPYSDLWEWYGRWSSGDLPSYRSRRQFVAEMFGPAVQQIRNRATARASSLEAVAELTAAA